MSIATVRGERRRPRTPPRGCHSTSPHSRVSFRGVAHPSTTCVNWVLSNPLHSGSRRGSRRPTQRRSTPSGQSEHAKTTCLTTALLPRRSQCDAKCSPKASTIGGVRRRGCGKSSALSAWMNSWIRLTITPTANRIHVKQDNLQGHYSAISSRGAAGDSSSKPPLQTAYSSSSV